MTRSTGVALLVSGWLASWWFTAGPTVAARAVPSPPPAGTTRADTMPSSAGEGSVDSVGTRPRVEGAVSGDERFELKNTLAQLGRREVPGERLWERRKVPKVALFSSAVLPGLGQVYNGRRIKVGLAAGFFSVYMAGAWLNWKDAQSWTAYRDKLPDGASGSLVRFANAQITFYKETSRDYLWWSAAIWVINMLDAWVDAHLFDLRVFTPPADIGGAQHSSGRPAGGSARPTHYLTYTAEF